MPPKKKNPFGNLRGVGGSQETPTFFFFVLLFFAPLNIVGCETTRKKLASFVEFPAQPCQVGTWPGRPRRAY